jgi:hypothetical protein
VPTKLTLVNKIADYGTSLCDQFGGDVAAYIGRSLLVCVCVFGVCVCVFMLYCSGVDSRTVQHTHTNKDLPIHAATSPPI